MGSQPRAFQQSMARCCPYSPLAPGYCVSIGLAVKSVAKDEERVLTIRDRVTFVRKPGALDAVEMISNPFHMNIN